eukprot:5870209-Pleurochrysis_carterae.AAC.1
MSFSSLLQVHTSATGQERYSESITYHNSVSGHSLNQKNIRLATAAAADVSILQAGNIVCAMPNKEYLKNDGAAFWLAKVEETEKADT